MPSASLLAVPMVPAGAVLGGVAAVRIDLRSPGEFEQDHLPGAVNVPLFDDVERAVIGTLYAHRAPQAAFEEGRARTQEKIGAFTARVAELAGWDAPPVDLAERVERLTAVGIARLERELVAAPCPSLPRDAVVFYCWRGGLRSRCAIAFLRGLGLDRALGIEGGYRAYRALVRARVEGWQAPPSFVLRGLTGVGKTLVLRALEGLRPGWTLDLEACAGHRSSILGGVGLRPVSQKRFESRIAERIARGFPGPCVLEGESRKVGDIVLSGGPWRALREGTALELTAPFARRVRVLIDDYLASAASRQELARALPFIEERLGERWSGALVALLETGQEERLVEILLRRYYDPLYRHSERDQRYAASFDSSDPLRAAEELARWIGERLAR